MEPFGSACSQLGEGIVCSGNWVRWVDIDGGRVIQHDRATGAETEIQFDQKVSAIVPTVEDTLLVALEREIREVSPTGRQLHSTTVPGVETGMRCNDGKAGPDGRLYIGTMEEPSTQPPRAKLWRMDRSRALTPLLQGVSISNGLAWRRRIGEHGAEYTMYYIDTPTRCITAYDFDLATGSLANGRTAVTVAAELGWPDGMQIDSSGLLWVALYGGSGVAVFDPDSGRLVRLLPVPARNVTSVAFGGADVCTLFITTAAAESPEEARLYPNAGRVFATTVPTPGTPGYVFGGQK